MLSVAAFEDGLHALAFPSFGSERTGAPVLSFCRIDDKPLRSREQIAEPDALIVQDPTLLHQVDVFAGLSDDGRVLINTTRQPEELGLGEVVDRLGPGRLLAVPATDIAREHLGRPLPNTVLVGAFSAFTGVVLIDAVAVAIKRRFVGGGEQPDAPARRDPPRGAVMDKPFAITLDVGSSLANKTGTWRTERAVHVERMPPCNDACPAGENGFFRGVRRVCDERGALLILDEVQAGLGRTGRMWAFERFDVVPDAVVTGKGLSAGMYPIAACCFNDRLEAHYEQSPFFHPSSYAGSEIGAQVVQALLAQYRDGGLLGHVDQMGARLEAGLRDLVASFPDRLAGVRGLGLMLALDTLSDAQGLELTRSCFEHGLLAIFAFNRQSTLQVMPPLVIDEQEVDEVLERLRAAVAAMP